MPLCFATGAFAEAAATRESRRVPLALHDELVCDG